MELVVTVAVGSSNPVKLEGVKRVFTWFFGEAKVLSAAYNGPRQPVGVDQTLGGAYHRAKHSLETYPSAHYGVGVEAGIIPIPRLDPEAATHLNTQYAVIIHRSGKVGVGSSSGFQVPSKVIEDILQSGKELDESFSERYGYKSLGETVGVVHSLTKGYTDRYRLVEQCVSLALIPFLNSELFL